MAHSMELSYGKQSVPVFKILKEEDGRVHSVIDMMVDIQLEGDVDKSWLSGDNSQILPTETQKNTCYAVALRTQFRAIEEYALALGRDILSRHAHLSAAQIDVKQRVWSRGEVGGQAHSHAFLSPAAPVLHTCAVRVVQGGAAEVRSGVAGLRLMKTRASGFTGYIVDEYTTLKPVGQGTGSASTDRIMATELEASWSFGGALPAGGFGDTNERLRQQLVEVFMGDPHEGTYSLSVQQTVYKMACALLESEPTVQEVSIAAPNIHHYVYDLGFAGLKNENDVFQSTSEKTNASGRIETVVRRGAVATSRL